MYFSQTGQHRSSGIQNIIVQDDVFVSTLTVDLNIFNCLCLRIIFCFECCEIIEFKIFTNRNNFSECSFICPRKNSIFLYNSRFFDYFFNHPSICGTDEFCFSPNHMRNTNCSKIMNIMGNNVINILSHTILDDHTCSIGFSFHVFFGSHIVQFVISCIRKRREKNISSLCAKYLSNSLQTPWIKISIIHWRTKWFWNFSIAIDITHDIDMFSTYRSF